MHSHLLGTALWMLRSSICMAVMWNRRQLMVLVSSTESQIGLVVSQQLPQSVRQKWILYLTVLNGVHGDSARLGLHACDALTNGLTSGLSLRYLLHIPV